MRLHWRDTSQETRNPFTTYRDASFTIAERDELEFAAILLRDIHLPVLAANVRKIVARWDANAATEFVENFQ